MKTIQRSAGRSGMTISEVAEASGVHVETIRYYQRRGLLPEPVRAQGSIRRYDEGIVQRTRSIRRAQALGFTLEETQALLRLDEMRACATTRRLAEQKLEQVRSRIADLKRVSRVLERLVSDCGRSRTGRPCPILHTLLEGQAD